MSEQQNFQLQQKSYKFCKLYLVKCNRFQLSTNKIWKMKSHIKSHNNLLHFLKCTCFMKNILKKQFRINSALYKPGLIKT